VDLSVAPLDATPVDLSAAPLDATPADLSAAPSDATPADLSAAPSDATPADLSAAPLDATPADLSDATPVDLSAAPSDATPVDLLILSDATPADLSAAPSDATPADGSAAPSDATPADLSVAPDEGTRCSLDGADCCVWKRKGAKIAVVFDDCHFRREDGWTVCDLAEWGKRAGPASTGGGIAMVLSERMENNAKLPCAFLGKPMAAISESPWQAFGEYVPAPEDVPSSLTSPTIWAPAPVGFPFRQASPLKCIQPFVSIPKGKTTIEPSTEPALLHACGVLIGNEYNTSKKKAEQRRWVAGVYQLGEEDEEEVMVPLSAVLELGGVPHRLDEVSVASIRPSLSVLAHSGPVCHMA